MDKGFYVGGFLYHEPSHQILLQQTQSPMSLWSLFESETAVSDLAPSVVFAKIIQETLQLKLVMDKIQEVYTYLNEDVNKQYSISYAPVKSLKTIVSDKGKIFAWFGPKEILKLRLSAQTRHDVIVGQRVIDAKERKRMGQHTFE